MKLKRRLVYYSKSRGTQQIPERFLQDCRRATLTLGWIAFLLLWIPGVALCQELAPPKDPIPAAFFGMHMHGIVVPRPDHNRVTPWPQVAIQSWRLWDAYVTWRDIEPQRGKWQFETLDNYVDIAEKQKAEIILTLGGSPAWASSAPDQSKTAPPKNIEDWKNYVRTVATRYKARIHLYEIWNEPNFRYFWTGTTQQLVDLSKEAYATLKQVDPSITVVSPSATTEKGLPWLDDFLAKGGGQYADVIGYHLYVDPRPPESMINLAKNIKKTMAAHNVGDLPLWDTEIGWTAPKPMPSDEIAAGYIMRAYIIAWASGITRQYWYSWDNHKYGLQVVDADDQTPSAAGRAYAEIEKWLTGGRMTACYSSGSFWITELSEAHGHPAKIVWNTNGRGTFRLPNKWMESRVTDFLGNAQPVKSRQIPVGPAPVLFE
jgi:hypothetical protein